MPGNLSRQGEIAAVFLKLGIIGFGGPAAHIALMQDEIVQRRGWLDDEAFLDLVGATNLIPGPNSTELAIHLGYHRGGFLGLITAGTCFLLPATILTVLFAWAYVSLGRVVAMVELLQFVKPAVLIIIIGAGQKLWKKAVKSRLYLALALLAAGLSLYGLSQLVALLVAGAAGVLLGYLWPGQTSTKSKPKPKAQQGQASSDENPPSSSAKCWSLPWLPILVPGNAVATTPSLLSVALCFLKIGAVLYGSGYVLIAYLEDEVVTRHAWLTQDQLLDAVAVGQLTPGPVLSAATFVGFVIMHPDGMGAALSGAGLATLGIFFPAFALVFIVNPFIPKLRQSRLTSLFLDAVIAASMGLMLAVTLKLGLDILVSRSDPEGTWRIEWLAVLWAVGSYFAIAYKKVSPVVLIVISLALGGLLCLGPNLWGA